MKKLIGTAMLAALLATSAFAELSMGAFVRTVVAPVAFDGDDVKAGWANSWGGIRNARISFNWTSDDEKVGMQYDIFGDGSSGFAPGDYRAGWYKPADWVKLMVGHIDNGYTMRSDLCFGSWNWMRPNNWIEGDEGITFNLGNFDGLQVELFPVEGLQILGRLALPADGGFTDAYKMFEQATFAAGYTIGDIGTVKVAWSGQGKREYKNKKSMHDAGYEVTAGTKKKYYASIADVYAAKAELEDKDELTADETALKTGLAAFDPTKATWVKKVGGEGEEKYLGDIQAAFDLTAVENLFVTVGVKVSIASSDYKKLGGANFALPGDKDPSFFNTFKGAVGASYQVMDNLKVSASYAIFMFYQPTGNDVDPAMQFGVGVDYGLTDSLGLSADFRALLPGNEKDPIFSFCVGVDWGFSSNGLLGIGFQGVIAGKKAAGDTSKAAVFPTKADKFSFAVPVKFQLVF